MSLANHLVRGLVGLAALFAISATTYAEVTYRIPRGFGWRQSVPLFLLDDEAVQKDLELSAEAARKLAQLKKLSEAETQGSRGTYSVDIVF
jgi:hypothetical protein